MSHIIKLGLKFKDLNVLEEATKALGATFTRNGTMRGYYTNQAKECPGVVSFEGCRYDIGVIPIKGSKNEWELEADDFVNYDKNAQTFMEKIKSEYAAQNIIKTARKKGFTYKRSTDKNGNQRIVVNHR